MSMHALYDLPAPAKINLFLHIVGRRADGYHLLQSVFALIDWADTLHFERRTDGQLARHDLGPTLPADDLCLRAARALQTASGCTQGADISIHKHVPWGAGMGGGSSDAATTLLALNRLWQLNWPLQRLSALGLQLGADVPFFLGGHNAFVQGIGEELRPVVLPAARYAVVKPAAALATRDIFQHPLLVRDTPLLHDGALQAAILAGSFDGALPDYSSELSPAARVPAQTFTGLFKNDLQAPAEDKSPEVAQVARWLEARFGNSRMTGSGSAVFARVETNSGTAASLQATWPAEEQLPQAWVGRMCQGLHQHPLLGWAD
jgi:4-diphosphocytidyl-2-C-methyl-D-erythritol kinase